MAKHIRRWTEEEEQVLLGQIKKNANNLSEAFRKASAIINRSVASCQSRWYKTLCRNSNTEICLITIGRGTKNVNRKNVASNTSDNTEKTTISWWNKLLAFLRK